MPPNNSSLTTFDQLHSLVDIDKNDHKLKDIAQLFLNAAIDWPTVNLTDVSDFIREFKQYYGTQLTKEDISKKSLTISDDNIWRHEAGNSIVQMLELSERFYNHSDFDEAVQHILSFYGQELQNVDFVADLKYLTTEEFENLRSQIATSSWGGSRYPPMAFTEQGVAMLSGILNSDIAINVNIQIIRIFTRMRQMLITNKDILLKLEQLEGKSGKHDQDIQLIFKYLKQLLNPPQPPRRKIGFIQEDDK